MSLVFSELLCRLEEEDYRSMGLREERTNLDAGGEFWKGTPAEIAEPGKSEASHTCRRTLLKAISGVLDLKQQ